MNYPHSKKQVAYLTRFFIFALILLIGYTVVVQTILIPRTIAMQYNQDLNPDLKKLRAKFDALSKSSTLPVYNDPFSNLSSDRSVLIANKKLIAQTEQALADYEQRAYTLPYTLFASHTENYQKAEVVRDKAKDVFSQSREVMKGYEELTDYLLQINTTQTVLKNNTADINKLADLNQLAGQGDVIAKRADQLGNTINTMKQMHVPAEFSAYHAALLASFEQSHTGLQELSKGLYAKDDTQVNSGVTDLQAAINKIETKDDILFVTASTNSSVLNETNKLADKIDSLQPFADE